LTGVGISVSLIFLIAGAIIVLGFFGSFLFERTRIPDVLILMAVGVVLGPVSGLFTMNAMSHFAEYFGAFALMVILFEGGMDMDLEMLVKEFGTASALVTISFVLSVAAIAGFFFFFQHWDGVRSLLFGTILGCTSSAIIMPIISRMSLKDDARVILSVESALSDVLSVVCTISLIEFVKFEKVGIETPFKAIASAFSIAVVAGAACGFLWLKIAQLLQGRKYFYMLTLAYILIVFAVVDILGGSGPIAVLLTGIVLGNEKHFSRYLKVKKASLVDDTVKFFHGEITFFIRTFFFVYIGTMMDFSVIDGRFLLISLLLLFIVLAVRYISTEILCLFFRDKKEIKFIIFSMMPRGLASAILAMLPMTINMKDSAKFISYTFAIIVLTNVVMSTGIFFSERRYRID
jgi:cell volume regulation protein A